MKKFLEYLLLAGVFIFITIPIAVVAGFESVIVVIAAAILISSIVIIAVNLICST